MKPAKKTQIVQITKVRMQKELKDKLTRSAERNNRTQNGELVARLEASFARDEEELRASTILNMLVAQREPGDTWRDDIKRLWAEGRTTATHLKGRRTATDLAIEGDTPDQQPTTEGNET
jgi:hypothetical protein